MAATAAPAFPRGLAAGFARRRLRSVSRRLEWAYPRLQDLSDSGTIPSGAEWLMDNHFVVRRAMRVARQGLSWGFLRRLPRSRDASVPRIEAWLRALLEAEGHALDQDLLAEAVIAAWRHEELGLAELWAIPLLLRLALLEQLGRDVEALLDAPVDRELDRRVAACVRSLLAAEKTDWNKFVERVSLVHAILGSDPARCYDRMDFETRDRYRGVVEELAVRASLSEAGVARRAVALVTDSTSNGAPAHVGEVLLGPGRERLEAAIGLRWSVPGVLARLARRHAFALYGGSIVLVAVAHLCALAVGLRVAGGSVPLVAGAVALAAVPAFTIGTSLVNWLGVLASTPSVLPKMDFSRGVPREQRTLVVIPGMLGRARDADALVAHLESHYLSCRDSAFELAILTDFRDAGEPGMPGDAELVERARGGIRRLNQLYGQDGDGPFHLLHRRRVWNEHQGCYMGWERKRGKLEELNRLLRGDTGTTYEVHEGRDIGSDVRHVITLDADTVLAPGAGRRLVETLAHPLNRASFDPRTGRVVSGYTLLQPRVDVAPGSSCTRFAWVFAGDGAYDVYSRAVSDVYQDLMGEGIFVGKGIYEVDGFQRSVAGRMPENRILSHDLLEGVHGRAGLATDMVVYEDYPPNHLTYMRRLHRWIRGDWQLLPWLGRRVPTADGGRGRNRLSLLSRWKILDNLRRSVLAPSLVLFLAVAWLLLPGPAWTWTALAVVVLATPMLTELGGGLLQGSRPGRFRPALSGTLTSAPASLARWLMRTVFLAHESIVSLDAVLRAIVRTTITHRNELQWTPAALAGKGADDPRVVTVEMGPSVGLSLALGLAVAVVRPEALASAALLLVPWATAPALAIWSGLERRRPVRDAPGREVDVAALRTLARRTWAYFETVVGPEDHWLPPDHFQEHPKGEVAHRTSPTNVGMSLLAAVAAHDLGHVGLLELIVRLRDTLRSVERLPGHRGHLLNWYDTTAMDPLEPRYVSTVDSGNLVAALMIVERASLELAQQAAPMEHRLVGICDAAQILDEELGRLDGAGQARMLVRAMVARLRAASADPVQWIPTLDQLEAEACAELDGLLLELYASGEEPGPHHLEEPRRWAVAVREEIRRTRQEIATLLPWLHVSVGGPVEGELGAAAEELRRGLLPLPRLGEARGRLDVARQLATDLVASAHARGDVTTELWARSLEDALREGATIVQEIRARLHELAEIARGLVARTDFSFLYDEGRELFYIGYDVSADRYDEHHYDLLASEARVASLVGIAKGDVPVRHWAKLGRPMGRFGGGRGLLSWSGTMFEYLMPPLILDESENTLLGASARAAVQAQIDHGRAHGVPWGVSESGYARVDAEQNYQYRAFGVPTTGFRRGLGRDVVIAPYASLMALRHAPGEVMANLERLQAIGAVGPLGAYEALDFTPGRVRGPGPQLVQSYMSHHQGMILLALDGFLRDEPMTRRMHDHPLIRSFEFLLRERPPGRIATERAQPAEEGAHVRSRIGAIDGWHPRDATDTQAHVVARGERAALVTARGGGHSLWRGIALTRPCLDPTLDEASVAMFVRDEDDGRLWGSSGPRDVASVASVTFQPHGAVYPIQADQLSGELAVAVVEGNAEIRLIRIGSRHGGARRLSIYAYAEVVLDDPNAYARHPAFSRLFVECEVLETPAAVVCHRRRRSPDEDEVWLACAMVSDGATLVGVETDRSRFLGRGQSRQRPALDVEPVEAGGRAPHAPVDPCVGLAVRVEVPDETEVECAFVMVAGSTRAEVLRGVAELGSLTAVRRAMVEAQLWATEEARLAGRDSDSLQRQQRLMSAILFPRSDLRAASEIFRRNRLGQSRLWRYAISGDLPLVVVRVVSEETSSFVRELLEIHGRCHAACVPFDLVILEEQATTYSATLTARLLAIIDAVGARLGAPDGGVFLVGGQRFEPVDRDLLLATARIVLDAGEENLDGRLAQSIEPVPLPRFEPPGQLLSETPPLPHPGELQLDNGLGGFSPDGREYVIRLEPGSSTPAPWINVLANPGFGTVVSERGAGYTFAGNSGRNRLTAWMNDATLDPPTETLYLRDELDGHVWSPTPAPAAGDGAYRVRHGAGYTVFEHHGHGLAQHVELFVDPDDPVKILRVEIRDLWGRARRITATFLVEWLLGTRTEADAAFVVTDFDADEGVALARNPWNEPFAEACAFVAASRPLHGLTLSRSEVLGHGGDRARPAGLGRIGLSGDLSGSTDPCAALQVHLDLDPGGTARFHFVLGQGATRAEALTLARRHRDPDRADRTRAAVDEMWDGLLSAVQIRTPDRGLDLLVNRWWLYQSIASRLWARTGHYQSSGAFGFRDQLQDVMALFHAAPAVARRHILEAAAHQFPEGDVLHWWHPPDGVGLRSRCSDDLLWLPLVTAEYVEATGDDAILDEVVPFVSAPPLGPGEQDRYHASFESGGEATLFEHCRRALTRGTTAGSHGLPLIGSCDWNDGFSRVGSEGRGESVWLGWFLHRARERFAAVCDRLGRPADAERLRAGARARLAAIERSWDGEWYLRAHGDNGFPLGSLTSQACRIDSIAQSWAVISGAGSPDRVGRAMDSVWSRLVDDEAGIVRLFEPPFEDGVGEVGYIAAYPPGVRENGGQYTHAAIWVAWAFVELDEVDRAARILAMLSPIWHARDPAHVLRYRVEPYVIAADVYGEPPHRGRGGWTWYTGAAAWAYRLVVEEILGVRRVGGRIQVDPRIPAHWSPVTVTVREGETTHEIRIERGGPGDAPVRVRVDGVARSLPFVLPHPGDERETAGIV